MRLVQNDPYSQYQEPQGSGKVFKSSCIIRCPKFSIIFHNIAPLNIEITYHVLKSRYEQVAAWKFWIVKNPETFICIYDLKNIYDSLHKFYFLQSYHKDHHSYCMTGITIAHHELNKFQHWHFYLNLVLALAFLSQLTKE